MNTIRQRLTWRLLLVWSVLLLIGGVSAYVTTRTALTRQFDNTLKAKAIAVASAVEFDHGSIVVDYSDWFMHEFDTNGTAYFEILDGGKVFRRSHSFPGQILSNTSLLPSSSGFDLKQVNQIPEAVDRDGKVAAKDGRVPAGSDWNDTRLPSGVPGRAVILPFVPHSDKEPNLRANSQSDLGLIIAMDRRELDQSLATLAEVMTVSGLLVLALTALTVPRLLRGELSPLDRLAEQAQLINAESLSARFPTDGLPGELAPISARLNDLLQRLQTSFARERQFSDDLAHEFRTPIAELRSLAELALKWPDTRNADTDRNALAIAMQMEAIISRLLAIARSDQGQTPLELKQVELTAMISKICEPLEARAVSRKLAIEADLPPALQIQSDPVLLRSIVTNLLDNAVEHATPPGAVRIASEQRNGSFTLRVTNPAPQLSAGDVPRLFDRFWRKDAARTGGEHSGLGLPLARAFATSLGYKLDAALDSEARLTMTLSGPAKVERPGQPVLPPEKRPPG